MGMVLGICRLCLLEKKLADSHIVPNAFFRKIKKSNNGLSIKITNAPTSFITETQESPSEYMLCQDCEAFIEKNYERASIDLLRDRKKLTVSNEKVIVRDASLNQLVMFALSVVWRASVSTNHFEDIDLTDAHNEQLRSGLSRNHIPPQIGNSVYIRRVVFGKGVSSEDRQRFKGAAVVPHIRKYGNYPESYAFIVEGFLFDIFLSSVPYMIKKTMLPISPDAEVMVIPFLKISDDPILMDLANTVREKKTSGMVSSKLAKGPNAQ